MRFFISSATRYIYTRIELSSRATTDIYVFSMRASYGYILPTMRRSVRGARETLGLPVIYPDRSRMTNNGDKSRRDFVFRVYIYIYIYGEARGAKSATHVGGIAIGVERRELVDGIIWRNKSPADSRCGACSRRRRRYPPPDQRRARCAVAVAAAARARSR